MQYQLDLIQHEVSGTLIHQRGADGYINASQLCIAAGRAWHQYIGAEANGNVVRELIKTTGLSRAQLILELKTETGTDFWVHPQLAVNVAIWLSPQFAARVSEWVLNWSANTQQQQQTQLSYHINRYLLNANQVPAGFFSILQEMTFLLTAPLEQQGRILAERHVPDISMAKAFCRYLRDNLGVDTDLLPVYDHIYPDGRVVEAKCYPEEYLAAFRRLIREDWIPNHAPKYFATRDADVLPHLDKLTLLPAPKTASPRGKPKFLAPK